MFSSYRDETKNVTRRRFLSPKNLLQRNKDRHATSVVEHTLLALTTSSTHVLLVFSQL